MKPVITSRLFALVLAVGSAGPLAAQEEPTTLSPDSDGGGEQFTLTCDAKKVLIGVMGGEGNWVNRVTGICSEVNAAGQWLGVQSFTGSTASSSGTPFTLKCPANTVVVALSGRSGQLLDKLQVHCRPVSGLRATGNMVLARAGAETSVGGTGGTTGFGPHECANMRIAKTLRGRKGNVLGIPAIDRIGLDCPDAETFRLTDVSSLYAIHLGWVGKALAAFSHAAPDNQQFAISGSGAVISVPSTETVGRGNTGKGFDIRTLQTGCALVTATYANQSRKQHVVVQPEAVAGYPMSMTTPNQLLLAGGLHTAQLMSIGPDGKVIRLQSSNPDVATVPDSIVRSGSAPMPFNIRGLKRGCTQIIASYGTYKVRRIVKVEEMSGAGGQ